MVARKWTLERWLSVAACVCLSACLLRNLGVVPPVLPRVWDKAYNGAEYLSIAICALRALRSRATERAAWAMLTLGLFGFAAGDLYYTIALSGDSTPPYPSLSDAGYLSIYPAAYIGLVLLLRARSAQLGSALWLDGLVCALASAAVGAALVLGVVAGTEGSFATVATNLAYPLGDLTMLAFVVVVMVITGRSAGSTWRFLALALTLFAAADTTYLYQVAVGTYREYTVLDTSWPAAYVLVAVAATRPAERLDTRRLRGGMLAFPAAFTLLALGLLVYDHYSRLHEVALWLATAAIAAAVLRFALTLRENLRTLGASEVEAATDALTGLGNRRALLADLERLAAQATPERPVLLSLFDLDGFKSYNDTFGHPAGDALLHRIGRSLAETLGDAGTAYRVGGDEFCLLSASPGADALPALAIAALSESGERFEIRSSHGSAWLTDGEDPVNALRVADQRMYADKRAGRRSTDEAVHQVLLRVAAEHDGELSDHVNDVAELVDAVGRRLGLSGERLVEARRAAALHDIGKVAIPDSILHAARALDADEWEYMRQHTIIGERIIGAAPELRGVGRIVRSSHERFDGGGYPDGLAGEEIPLGARIVAVCDAYDAMITDRAYRLGRPRHEALEELARCAGGQFDPIVVAAFTKTMANDFAAHECAMARKGSIERALDVIN
jgi:two-component system cell cycle response regulator